ncbi:hypothetical protein BS50DRAFT_551142 [Corynespora cassiicola Philippines]|uniref:ZZ-type domain-containing protein n=1 Tax=Corynespora cassiicola Philippines TaxID=1448308 RepID=A0A2T2NRA1_CORCC|nr:hypothetical protein BS50DRAFT_551142 [Corynespora cassiicola Philippines]
MATNVPVTLDTLIVIKVQFQGHSKKFKIPLRDLGANVLPEKVRDAPAASSLTRRPNCHTAAWPADPAGAYVTLDSDKPQVYKTLFRAAKAKLKLRLRATIPSQEPEPATLAPSTLPQEPVPSPAPSSLHRMSADTLSPEPAVAPVIAHSPPAVESAQVSPVCSLAPQKADTENEAPVPRSFTARESFFGGLATASQNADLAFRPKETATQCSSWVVYCNNCNQPMEDEHFHCSICDNGDYDLCPSCVDAGIHCPGANHWMVKRFVKNGSVVNSTTERVGPKPKPQAENEMPGAFTDEKQPVPVYEPIEPTRTCNCCVKVLPEKEFVTCINCDDYDLCLQCHVSNKHGHHPGHSFKAATSETTLPTLADFLCNAGRNVRHSAVCDGCEKFIYGVRHKCLNCPDWDFCAECIKNAKYIHPRHRFVPIYEPLAEPVNTGNRHYGIYCDGPLCKDRENLSYIEGVRYKCAVCHDTDFCSNCEAHPSNRHNHTHPLIKFKTPVRSVSVTTLNENKDGKSITRVGDREQPARKSTATETTPVAPSANAATQVQTIVDMRPTEEQQPKITKEKIEIRDLLAEPVQEKITVQDLLSAPAAPAEEANPEPVAELKAESSKNNGELDAHFIRDTIPDGSKISAGFQFIQVWTLRNPGPNAWPAGCSVRHVGGDNMLNIDNSQPLSQSELAEASESNVVGREVQPNEEISFRVIMKAPKREGTAISYWRLKKADGTPFGHRLWCDIQVANPPVPSPPQPEPVPEVAEASSSSSTANLTPYERFQQAKLDKLRASQRLQAQLASRRLEKSKDMVRKAAVERLLENRRKDQEAAQAHQEKIAQPEKAPEAPVKQETAELPVEEKPIQQRPEPTSSGMIFPQLEKESPESSTHEALAVEPASPKTETTATATVADQSDEEFFEDAESVEIRSISSDDEGFMTDEEYDILDASDEEMP